MVTELHSLPQSHMLPPVCDEDCYPPAEGFGHIETGELVLQQSWEDGVEGGTAVHQQDPDIG